MGYSCTAKAALVLDAVQAIMDAALPNEKSSNKLPGGGFWERGREQPDGAVTGTTWKPSGPKMTDAQKLAYARSKGWTDDYAKYVGDPCRRAGSFKISADGKIVRFPGLTKAQKTAAERAGANAFAERFGGFNYDTRGMGRGLVR
jgi:hypothetical protein